MSRTVTCNDCSYSGSIREVEVHSCEIAQNGGRCEDFPCCGHSVADGCQTRPEHTMAYWVDQYKRADEMGIDLDEAYGWA